MTFEERGQRSVCWGLTLIPGHTGADDSVVGAYRREREPLPSRLRTPREALFDLPFRANDC